MSLLAWAWVMCGNGLIDRIDKYRSVDMRIDIKTYYISKYGHIFLIYRGGGMEDQVVNIFKEMKGIALTHSCKLRSGIAVTAKETFTIDINSPKYS